MSATISTFAARLGDMDGCSRRRALRELARQQGELVDAPRRIRLGYTLKAALLILFAPAKNDTDGGLVLAVVDYQPDFEYANLGSWEELAVGYGARRGWWWAWGHNSSV